MWNELYKVGVDSPMATGAYLDKVSLIDGCFRVILWEDIVGGVAISAPRCGIAQLLDLAMYAVFVGLHSNRSQIVLFHKILICMALITCSGIKLPRLHRIDATSCMPHLRIVQTMAV